MGFGPTDHLTAAYGVQNRCIQPGSATSPNSKTKNPEPFGVQGFVRSLSATVQRWLPKGTDELELDEENLCITFPMKRSLKNKRIEMRLQ